MGGAPEDEFVKLEGDAGDEDAEAKRDGEFCQLDVSSAEGYGREAGEQRSRDEIPVVFSEGEQEWGADHHAEDQGDVHELTLTGGPSHKEGQEDAEGGDAEDDDFGVHGIRLEREGLTAAQRPRRWVKIKPMLMNLLFLTAGDPTMLLRLL